MRFGDAADWGEWRRCEVCTLEFADLLNPNPDLSALYEAAYSGNASQSGLKDFAARLKYRRALIASPSLTFWTPAYDQVVDWIEKSVLKAATILEIGCGMGYFLHTLRRAGFFAVGLDVAKTAVDVNILDGFKVWHGAVETIPDGWVKPDVIVSMFVLHHTENPATFLRTIHERWPQARLVISVYGPENWGPTSSQPPRTLTSWNARSLRTALELAGYSAIIDQVPSTGLENKLFRRVNKFVSNLSPILPAPLLRLTRLIGNQLMPRILGKLQRQGWVLVSYGTPLSLHIKVKDTFLEKSNGA